MAEPAGKTGVGTKTAHPGAVDARARLAQARAVAAATRAARVAAQERWLASVTDLSLDELRTTAPARFWTVAMLHLGGYDATAIARAVQYTSHAAAVRALKHPAVVRIVALVREAQLERVLRGEYGVAAQAKAAAPAVMEHLTELAGGRKDRATGARVGRAKRDADAVRAADLVLTTSGDKVARTAHVHFHVLEQLSDAELEAFSARGEWPERLAGVGGLLPGPAGGDP
jgi:hypothetical protein